MASTSDAPRRGPEHDALAAFIGEWHAEGKSYAIAQSKTDPRGSVERWVSDETFEWLPGKFFVLQRWKAMTGENAFDGLAVIGYDAERRRYVTRSFENHGFFREYETRVDGDVWTFTGERERARVEFTDGGKTQAISWEWRPEGDEWLPLCDRTARRTD